MQGHGLVNVGILDELCSLFSVHGNVEKLRLSYLNSSLAKVEQGEADVVALEAVGNILVVDGVAREIDGVGKTIGRAKVGGGDDEADTLALRSMFCRRGNNLKSLSASDKGGLVTRIEARADGFVTNLNSAVFGCEDLLAFEDLAADLVEVVGMILVAEKNGVDGRKVFGLDGGILSVFEHDNGTHPFRAGRREKWVGQEGDIVDLEKGSGSPNVGDADGALERRHCCLVRSGNLMTDCCLVVG